MKTAVRNIISLWVLPGLIAGVVFLSIALGAGALATSVWAMPDAIAQTVGIAAPADYSFALLPVLVGVVIHLTLSIGLGVIYTALVRMLHLYGWRLMAVAVIYVSIETPIALWVVMHNMLPATTFHFFLAAIPLWGSVIGHYMYALTLGLLLMLNPSTSSWKLQQPPTWQAAR